MLGVARSVLACLRLLVRFFCVFFNVLSGLVNGYDICITTGILDSIDGDLQLCHDDAEVSTCFLKDRFSVHGHVNATPGCRGVHRGHRRLDLQGVLQPVG